jgi:hypothetical protein
MGDARQGMVCTLGVFAAAKFSQRGRIHLHVQSSGQTYLNVKKAIQYFR